METLTQEYRKLLFKGTPHDFGGAVTRFIKEYYSDATAWTGCTFTPQQTGVDHAMPNYSVEIECPAAGGGLPAFVWVTAWRLSGGKSMLEITTERYDYDRSPELQTTLDGFLKALIWEGWIATPEDVATRASAGEGATPGGRSSYPEDIWARQEVLDNKRDQGEVYHEWIPKAAHRSLQEPYSSFKKMLKRERDKRKKGGL